MKSVCSVDTVEHVQVALQLLGGCFNNNLHISEQTQSRKRHLWGTLTFTLKQTHTPTLCTLTNQLLTATVRQSCHLQAEAGTAA